MFKFTRIKRFFRKPKNVLHYVLLALLVFFALPFFMVQYFPIDATIESIVKLFVVLALGDYFIHRFFLRDV